MGQADNAPQTFNGGEVFAIHGSITLLLIAAVLLGHYVASKKWPNKNPTNSVKIDIVTSLPIACFLVWLIMPRIGIAGDKIALGYSIGNPSQMTSFVLCFGMLMFAGMSIHFSLPNMKAALTKIGPQLLARFERAFGAFFNGDASKQGAGGGGKPAKRSGTGSKASDLKNGGSDPARKAEQGSDAPDLEKRSGE
jgi:hypothetical protein